MNSIAQNNLDCDKKLLAKEIDIKLNNLEEFKRDFSNLKNCGLDSLDIEIFSNNSVLGSILISIVSSDENEKTTYGDLLDKLIEIKNSKDYIKAREASLISNELSSKIAKIENWEEDKIKLKKLEVSEIEIEQIFNYLKENPNSKNYKEIFLILNLFEYPCRHRDNLFHQVQFQFPVVHHEPRCERWECRPHHP